ncbi:hypothetical protein F4677DRAFT_148712 [Hypoxylon crocopeplum]|nr:hypothetical protein F4677DRAFT_148712 [Hypoxylon crocopeplum]
MDNSDLLTAYPKGILKILGQTKMRPTMEKDRKRTTAAVAFDDVVRDMETGERVLPSTRLRAEYVKAVEQRRGSSLIDLFRAMEMGKYLHTATSSVKRNPEGEKWNLPSPETGEVELAEESEADDESNDDGGFTIVFETDDEEQSDENGGEDSDTGSDTDNDTESEEDGEEESDGDSSEGSDTDSDTDNEGQSDEDGDTDSEEDEEETERDGGEDE